MPDQCKKAWQNNSIASPSIQLRQAPPHSVGKRPCNRSGAGFQEESRCHAFCNKPQGNTLKLWKAKSPPALVSISFLVPYRICLHPADEVFKMSMKPISG